ncbi:hypothetical protein FA10DRAFT_265813 [Acaromyces ingoldii]|uniref:Uncharacterized protein n=1 Tax=Acaromyces ingoldii TaxID=215250 RepID=A0A316YSK6_9BASI|nr:hypothetical protein FA10DRAFT_265813 [Acaromyces ingoldii]PWN92006.1 hypothetical protein FA10DRAFT_265813 [Acaromyces ingoldii]
MPAPTNTTMTAAPTAPAGATAQDAQEGSKIRRFFKRFGRRPSDEVVQVDESGANGDEGVAATQPPARTSTTGDATTAKKTGSMRSRRGSKPGSSGNLKGGEGAKKSDSILSGRFFHTGANAPPVPKQQQQQQQQQQSAKKTSVAAPVTGGFGGSSGEGLANTLGLPSTPPPQLDGLPVHDPIAAGDLMSSPPKTAAAAAAAVAQEGAQSRIGSAGDAPLPADGPVSAISPGIPGHAGIDDISSGRISGSDSGQGHRDSVDNNTMDTQKSRASTKPTTLMSFEREGGAATAGNPPMLAQIAQHRHGEGRGPSIRSGDNASIGHQQHQQLPPQASAIAGSSAIQFAAPPAGRSTSGSLVQLPGQNEPMDDQPYVNVPSLSRPHPSNNPHPSGQPGDDASVLTLASSTAAASIGGGAASSRGHSHHAARSIGGSLMNERRNSSDTYASMKAIPPLSRRGSDASERTGMSIAASATGRNSAQAMTNAPPMTAAPSDRVLHRTASQRTVATQLSIPLTSTSTSNLAVGQGQAMDVPAIKTTAPPSSSSVDFEGDKVQQHADELAATNGTASAPAAETSDKIQQHADQLSAGQ